MRAIVVGRAAAATPPRGPAAASPAARLEPHLGRDLAVLGGLARPSRAARHRSAGRPQAQRYGDADGGGGSRAGRCHRPYQPRGRAHRRWPAGAPVRGHPPSRLCLLRRLPRGQRVRARACAPLWIGWWPKARANDQRRRYGVSHVPLAPARRTASSTRMFSTLSSSGSGCGVPSRIEAESASPATPY